MIIRGSQVQRDLKLRTQVVIVGSGASGAVIAKELSEAGKDVIVLEEGRHVSPEEYGPWRPSQTLRRIGRAGGTSVAVGIGDSPTISILAGSCVGGSSVMTGGVCFRMPEQVHKEWIELAGTESLSSSAMEAYYQRVEKNIQVSEVPVHMRSRGTELFGLGLERQGHHLEPIRRNTKNCCGCSQCNFGCPHKAKLSVDLNYIPQARSFGTRIYSDMRVERVLFSGDKAVGVEGVILGEPNRKPIHRFELQADTVVMAAGTMHTPLILQNSQTAKRSGQLGKNLTLHPAFRISGYFDENVDTWHGAMQSAYYQPSDDDKLLFISISVIPNVLASTQHGIGPEFMKKVKDLRHIGTFGAMVHDKAGGKIWKSPGREPIVTYKMAKEDKQATIRGMRFLARTYLEAGANKVTLPIIGHPPIYDLQQLESLQLENISATQYESMSFHPLGSCRMGSDPRSAVVDPSGRCFGTSNLWIADGSIFPTSVGVNTQLPIMSIATKIAFDMIESKL